MSSRRFGTTSPLEDFFAQFPGFHYNRRSFASDEIRRLISSNKWTTIYDETDDVYEAYRDALTLEFNTRYGSDADNATAWQQLCVRIGADPIPETMKECRELFEQTHVNIIDLLHAHEVGGVAVVFSSVAALSEYTIDSKKYFPKENANAGNLLKFLLRNILNPELEFRRGGGGGRGKKRGPGGRKRRN